MARLSARRTNTELREYQAGDDVSRRFLTGVSLHAHTHHSQESLAHLPRYITQIPVIGRRFDHDVQAHEAQSGARVDFSKGWWHPPVSPRAVFDSEADQITGMLGLQPLVSVTDHDSIIAGLELQRTFAPRCSPISFEWTVPFDEGFLHVGIHNLPQASAKDWFARLAAFTTAGPRQIPAGTLDQLFEELDALPDLLIVLNHPMWDLAGVGAADHHRLLTRFLAAYGHRMHGLELNGYRSRAENLDVCALACETGHPLISGGDRHACAPNALLNLSHASSFAGFVHEIRAGISTVITMPAYREHIIGRTIASVADVVTQYQHYPDGWQHWTDRISCLTSTGLAPLSKFWPNGGPFWLRSTMATVRFLAKSPVRRVVAQALEWNDRRVGTPSPVAWPRLDELTRSSS